MTGGSITVASAVTVASGGTLGGSGTINGTLAPGGAGTDIKTLNAGTTTWNGGSVWNFDLASSGSTSDKLAITGNFTKGSAGTYKFDFAGSTPFWNTTFDPRIRSWKEDERRKWRQVTADDLIGLGKTTAIVEDLPSQAQLRHSSMSQLRQKSSAAHSRLPDLKPCA